MASERDLELLDDYIANRLNSQEKAAFEGKLTADPELQRELKLQQSIVDSVRTARAAELKAMLNNIPPSAIPASETSSVAKWSGVAVAVIVAVGLYFYLKPSEKTQPEPIADTVTLESPSAEVPEVQEETKVEEPAVSPTEDKTPANDDIDVDSGAKKATQPSVKTKPSPVQAPQMDVYDPSAENEASTSAPETSAAPKSTITGKSEMTAEVISDNKNYTFHYQFKSHKLILYGNFDKNLYEILEFISDNKRTIFLYYKDNYYLLNQAGDKVKPLSPVNDPVLIQKLKEHRGQ